MAFQSSGQGVRTSITSRQRTAGVAETSMVAARGSLTRPSGINLLE
jgi:hypothetical protein